MLSNLAFSRSNHQIEEWSSFEKNNPDQRCLSTKITSILTENQSRNNSPLQLQATVEKTSTRKEQKPLYVNERDDDDTVSVLSDEGLNLDTRFDYDENENSAPPCSFGSNSIRQQQHYIGGNYFFRQDSDVVETEYQDVISFPSGDQSEQYHKSDSKSELSFSCDLPRPSSNSSCPEVSVGEGEFRQLVLMLREEKSVLSQKCLELEKSISDARRDHNCYKAKMTMAMGSLRIQMESERDDKAYLLKKCQSLKEELSALKSNYDSKPDVISALKNDPSLSTLPRTEVQDTI